MNHIVPNRLPHFVQSSLARVAPLPHATSLNRPTTWLRQRVRVRASKASTERNSALAGRNGDTGGCCSSANEGRSTAGSEGRRKSKIFTGERTQNVCGLRKTSGFPVPRKTESFAGFDCCRQQLATPEETSLPVVGATYRVRINSRPKNEVTTNKSVPNYFSLSSVC
ncbi:hypothetical protein SAMN05421858_2832 [Haladaptatus litoreus]|uniref:Uncharacterized protein n=1 Tax=Haladaptatus litoreus TaxID=553468 RepID=A0A1N7BY13_9EURY|nr:hypothetical protein SAMN05421858_2832 [Haladaptatus litoreus]